MELTTQSFDLARPAQSIEVAEILQRFVKEKNLTSNIKGKDYPQVEAWQFAGSQLGLYPELTSVENLSNDKEIKFAAWVEVKRISDGKIMSKGYAICSNKESSKKYFDEYAICSMAQTRAVGKAFRMLLSWLMKAAGFEATPAEEMDFAKAPEPDFSDVPDKAEKELLRKLVYGSDLNEDERMQAFEAIDTCVNYTVYQKIQHRLEERQMPIDSIPNPNQTDINKHLKKTVQ
jgi:hypothetical protein